MPANAGFSAVKVKYVEYRLEASGPCGWRVSLWHATSLPPHLLSAHLVLNFSEHMTFLLQQLFQISLGRHLCFLQRLVPEDKYLLMSRKGKRLGVTAASSLHHGAQWISPELSFPRRAIIGSSARADNEFALS
jgi:hypothetical protein